MNLALNNLQKLIWHKTQTNKQANKQTSKQATIQKAGRIRYILILKI